MSADEKNERDTDLELVDKAMRSLSDHFDAIQIFAVRYDPTSKDSNTIRVSRGLGNYWTRYGVVKGWLLEEEQEIANPKEE